MKLGYRPTNAWAAGGVLFLMIASAGGCAQPKRVVVWQPKPLVRWTHLATEPIVPVQNEYRFMPASAENGLFPASLAVTRVAVENTGDLIRPLQPRLTSDPRNEFLQWNSALDDQMAIGEVFPIAENDLGGGAAEPEQILAAFRALDARLGLVYAVNELSETETEMFGVLYDAVRGRPLAAIHTRAESIVPPEAVRESQEPIDLWETDARALVRARFEKLLQGCIRELIRRDRPASVVVPTGWIPAEPARPVEWPPRGSRANP